MRDVARVAAVSQRTVSNVVNGSTPVRPGTRQRVLDAIDVLGFHPNVAAQRLRGGRTGLLALALPEIAAPYFAELADHVHRVADIQGFTLLVDQTAGALSRELLVLNGFRTSVIDGLILSALSLTAGELAGRDPAVPLVLLGEFIEDSGVFHVSIDNLSAARTATEHLLTLGRRRIAVLGAPRPEQLLGPARRRLDGFLDAMAAAGLVVRPTHLIETVEWTLAEGYAVGRRLVEDRIELDGLLCFNDTLATGAMKALVEGGRTVPHDVAVVGWDGTASAAYTTPALTSITPDTAEIARIAVDAIVTQLAGGEVHQKEVIAPYSLVIRESSAATPVGRSHRSAGVTSPVS